MDSHTRRWEITDGQRAILESSYADNPFPDLVRRKSLAGELSVTPRQVQVWFQNRRQKERSKKNSESKSLSNHEDHAKPDKGLPNGENAELAGTVPSSPTTSDTRSSPSSPPALARPPMMPPPPMMMMPPPPMLPPTSSSLPMPSLAGMLLSSMPAAARGAGAHPLAGFGDLLSCGGGAMPTTMPLSMPPPPPPHELRLSTAAGVGVRLLSAPGTGAGFGCGLPQNLSQMLRPGLKGAISKQPRLRPRMPVGPMGGVPMDRRAISMDALEVLSSQFAA